MLIAMMYYFGFTPTLRILYAIPVIGMLGHVIVLQSVCVFRRFKHGFAI